MSPNPFLGVVLHSIGGLAAGSCFIPFKWIRRWSWETYWLLNAFFGWIVTGWVVVVLTCPKVLTILHTAPRSSFFLAYLCGALWGIGGLSFGLSMRYLGFSLGYALSLGFCAAFGTIVPPIIHGRFSTLLTTLSGSAVLAGILICLVGIAVCGKAGINKERELTAEEKKATVAEFNFWKGIWVAAFAGIMSGCFAVGIDAGKPIARTAVQMGTAPLWQVSPVYIPILAGGFTTNFLYCMFLSIRNRSLGDYMPAKGVPYVKNVLLAALAGFTWYEQLMFYGMGTTRMGRYDFSSYSIHVAFIVIFSNIWGMLFREWTGTRRNTHLLVFLGLLVLMASTVVMGLGNYIATLER